VGSWSTADEAADPHYIAAATGIAKGDRV